MNFDKISPLTGEVEKKYSYQTADLIQKRLQILHESYLQWSQKTVSERQSLLRPVVTRMQQSAPKLADLITLEMGKPLTQSKAEVEKCIESIAHLCEIRLDCLEPQQLKNASYKKSHVYYRPLGVIYSIMPWNFPLWQAIRMILPALLSGNVVYLKHSEVTPEMGRMIEELFKDLFSEPVLFHDLIEHSLTEKICADPRVGGVSLTGSTAAGFKIADAAAKSLKPCVLELGGSDPYLVCADADLQKAAQLIAKSRLQNSGQSCIAAKRALVDAKVKDDFLDLLKIEFSKNNFGDPHNLQTDIGPLAQPRFKIACQEQLSQLQQKTGAQMVFEKKHEQSEKSAFVDSHIFLISKAFDWFKDQEFFSPNLMLFTFQTESEAVKLANSTFYGLAAAVFSKDLGRAKKMASQIIAGQVSLNDFIRSDVDLPFGGAKFSGLGREMAEQGLKAFTQTQVISE